MTGSIDQEAVAANGRRRSSWWASLFLLPALVLLGALVVYPIFFSVVRSLLPAVPGGTRGGSELSDDVRL